MKGQGDGNKAETAAVPQAAATTGRTAATAAGPLEISRHEKRSLNQNDSNAWPPMQTAH
jgi:hypothetical protein